MTGLLLFLAAGNFFSSAFQDTTHKPDFYWGANGHPIYQEAYFNNLPLQFAALRRAGLSFYRVDMAAREDGTIPPAVNDRFYRLLKMAVDSSVTLIPVLPLVSTDTLYTLTADTAYQRGLATGRGFAAAYGKYFSYYELGNEDDLKVMIQPAGDGSEVYHYDLDKLKILAACLRGMSQGIREVNSQAGIIISNGGWRHYMYFDLLEKEGVVWNIIGYHWYEDAKNLRPVLRVLRSWYPDKRVWFTEINSRSEGMEQNAHQLRMLQKDIKAIQRLGSTVDALFFYELLDEPATAPREAHYGIYSWDRRYDSVLPKPMLEVIRKVRSEWISH